MDLSCASSCAAVKVGADNLPAWRATAAGTGDSDADGRTIPPPLSPPPPPLHPATATKTTPAKHAVLSVERMWWFSLCFVRIGAPGKGRRAVRTPAQGCVESCLFTRGRVMTPCPLVGCCIRRRPDNGSLTGIRTAGIPHPLARLNAAFSRSSPSTPPASVGSRVSADAFRRLPPVRQGRWGGGECRGAGPSVASGQHWGRMQSQVRWGGNAVLPFQDKHESAQ